MPRRRAIEDLTCSASALPFDLTCLKNVRSEGFENGFLPELETEAFRYDNQPPLVMADGRERLDEFRAIPTEFRPVRQLM